MDFGSQQHFYGTNHSFQFMNMQPPLTPHTGDDFHSRTSPEFQDSFPAVAAHFDPSAYTVAPNPAAHFGSQNSFGPPTPPNAAVHQVPGTFPPQPARPQHGVGTMPTPDMSRPKSDSEDHGINRPGSEEEDGGLTPAQSRRKAQNRAAQRAFRERKERHVKDLEAEVALLKAANMQTYSECERLKKDLQKMSTENEILRATSAVSNSGSAHGGSMSPEPSTTGPLRYNVSDIQDVLPRSFYTSLLKDHRNKTPSHRIVTSDDGERLLAAGAAWEFLIDHPLFKRGLVDVEDVSDRLKNNAKCDGQGPVFSERAILEAIENSVASGSDELL
jgi:AP-1-like factor